MTDKAIGRPLNKEYWGNYWLVPYHKRSAYAWYRMITPGSHDQLYRQFRFTELIIITQSSKKDIVLNRIHMSCERDTSEVKTAQKANFMSSKQTYTRMHFVLLGTDIYNDTISLVGFRCGLNVIFSHLYNDTVSLLGFRSGLNVIFSHLYNDTVSLLGFRCGLNVIFSHLYNDTVPLLGFLNVIFTHPNNTTSAWTYIACIDITR